MSRKQANCAGHQHPASPRSCSVSNAALERASRLFRAVGDVSRLKLLALLAQGEACVTELAQAEGEELSTISQRLRVLRSENIVVRRRRGKHINYALADQHVMDLVFNALAHSSELPAQSAESETSAFAVTTGNHQQEQFMEHTIHENHDHIHNESCGHTAVRHDGHVDYLHDGHLHHVHDTHVDEHAIAINSKNPAEHTPNHDCGGHEKGHTHGRGCGHEAVPHGDHVDYLVKGHLHHPDGDHCDHHGALELTNA